MPDATGGRHSIPTWNSHLAAVLAAILCAEHVVRDRAAVAGVGEPDPPARLGASPVGHDLKLGLLEGVARPRRALAREGVAPSHDGDALPGRGHGRPLVEADQLGIGGCGSAQEDQAEVVVGARAPVSRVEHLLSDTERIAARVAALLVPADDDGVTAAAAVAISTSRRRARQGVSKAMTRADPRRRRPHSRSGEHHICGIGEGDETRREHGSEKAIRGAVVGTLDAPRAISEPPQKWPFPLLRDTA